MRSTTMRTPAYLLIVSCTLGWSVARADGGLQGLEMDVMDAGESPAQATARIELPGASTPTEEDRADGGDLAIEHSQPGSNARAAAALDTVAPAEPEAAADAASELEADKPGAVDSGGH